MTDHRTDRGAATHLSFNRCARGFILMTTDFWESGSRPRTIYAFDQIEDLAAWLVEEYRDPPEDGDIKQPA